MCQQGLGTGHEKIETEGDSKTALHYVRLCVAVKVPAFYLVCGTEPAGLQQKCC